MCSTYSMRTRSGPQRNAAYVFAASTTDSTSIPRSPRRRSRRLRSPPARPGDSGAAAPAHRDLLRGRRRTHRPPPRAPPPPARSRSARTPARSAPARTTRARRGRGRTRHPSPPATRVSQIPSPASNTSGVPVRQRGTCRGEIGDAQGDVLQRAGLARAFGVEERQLAASRIAAEQREVLLLRDHVHAEVTLEERDDGRAVSDPEGNVIESLRLHRSRTLATVDQGAETGGERRVRAPHAEGPDAMRDLPRAPTRRAGARRRLARAALAGRAGLAGRTGLLASAADLAGCSSCA